MATSLEVLNLSKNLAEKICACYDAPQETNVYSVMLLHGDKWTKVHVIDCI